MELFTVPELAELANGKVVGKVKEKVHTVCIDSRKIGEGSLFIPLKGKRVDGHDFISQAFENGAAVSLVSKEQQKKYKISSDKKPIIIVDDTFEALQTLALSHLKKMKNLVKIGITGSNGKTTTKEIIGSILSIASSTVINEGNLNSEIGVPLSAFKVKPEHKYAIFEMGMDHKGEMDRIVKLVKPTYALITNIGIAHIEQLGTKDEIANEKKKIFKYFDGHQYGFIYEKEEYYNFLKDHIRGSFLPYGFNTTEGYTGYMDLGLLGTTINWEGLQVQFPLFGIYNLKNALGAISLAVSLGVKPEIIKEGLEKVKPLFGRSEIIKGSITIIRDCYNSNPDAAVTVLDFFNKIIWKRGNKVVMLGSMLELGVESEKAHEKVVNYALKQNIDLLLLFGKEMQAAYEGINSNEFKGIFWAEDFDIMLDLIKKNIKHGDLVLLKGSRSMELERFVAPIQKI